MSVARFVARLGIPRATWYYWREASLRQRPLRRWPAPVVDALEDVAAAKHLAHSQWGHRKIWALLRSDGVTVSQASVKRALARRGLLLPVRSQAQRRTLAQARRVVFREPPTRRNRVWQTDFSEVETSTGGTWLVAGVVDYHGKVCLALHANPTQTARDAIGAIQAAIDRAEELLGHRLLDDCLDHDTGELQPVVIVSDNGPPTSPTRSPGSS